ncbi:hypothetical protein M5K25_015861 [Dendrobium thyrsiflorum]|uniref:Uncharacterized protein n=1 Tax=Dendrobium thyrsiflorum TaxID=117978 RepID=A0ABD0USA7_DENTH
MNQIKITVEERISSMEGEVADLRDMMKKLLEIHNQTTASVAKVKKDTIGMALAGRRKREERREEKLASFPRRKPAGYLSKNNKEIILKKTLLNHTKYYIFIGEKRVAKQPYSLHKSHLKKCQVSLKKTLSYAPNSSQKDNPRNQLDGHQETSKRRKKGSINTHGGKPNSPNQPRNRNPAATIQHPGKKPKSQPRGTETALKQRKPKRHKEGKRQIKATF